MKNHWGQVFCILVFFWILSIASIGCNDAENPIVGATSSEELYPNAPQSLTAEIDTTNTVVILRWSDVSQIEDRYEVWMGIGEARLRPKTSLEGNTQGWEATGLNPNTWYTFNVHAINGQYYSIPTGLTLKTP